METKMKGLQYSMVKGIPGKQAQPMGIKTDKQPAYP